MKREFKSKLFENFSESLICHPEHLSPPYSDVMVTNRIGEPVHWLIGPYQSLKNLSSDLRMSKYLNSELLERGVSFGFRDTDKPALRPTRQPSYGANIPLVGENHAHERKKLWLPPADSKVKKIWMPTENGALTPGYREIDVYENRRLYHLTQSPQAHHIIEVNNLKRFGLGGKQDKGDFGYFHLPCALFAEEFHQKYIGARLECARSWEGTPDVLLSSLEDLYGGVYQMPGEGLAAVGDATGKMFSALKQELFGPGGDEKPK
jgi:hypothetical protein